MQTEKTTRKGLKKYSFWTLWIAILGFVSLVFLFDRFENMAQIILFFSLVMFGVSGILDALHSYQTSEWFYFQTVTGKKARVYAILELIAISIIFFLPGIIGFFITIL